MEIKRWIIEFKPSENIRELALLVTVFFLSVIGIFIIVTNNRNDHIKDSYSKFETKDDFYKAMAAAAVAAKSLKENSTSSGQSILEAITSKSITTITDNPRVLVEPVIDKSGSQEYVYQAPMVQTTTIQTTTVKTSYPLTMPPILQPQVQPIAKGTIEKTNGMEYIFLPMVIKSIPQSTTSRSSFTSGYTPYMYTTSGSLEGIAGNFNGTSLDVFLGVPYAQPPVGELRFRNPVKVLRSDKTIECTSVKPHCLQKFNQVEIELRTPTIRVMSEDCLYLNIWRPRNSQAVTFPSATSFNKAKPIMIWLFGGGFQGGTNNLDEFDGRVIAAIGDVVVVTVNYRNGPLGYLDLGTDDVPGNQGLRDIVAAIEWVRANAIELNGNPGQITLFGESSGSIAISLLMSNNEIASMVRRVILQSGSPLLPGKLFKKSLSTSLKFAKYLNCPMNSQAASCLRALTSEELYKFYDSDNFKKLSFAPKAGDELIPFLPEDLFFKKQDDVRSGKFYNATLEVMMGVTSNESNIMFMLDFPQYFSKDKINYKFNSISDVEDFIEFQVAPKYGLSKDEAFLVSHNFFQSSGQHSSDDLMKNFLKVTSDLMFVCPSKLFAEKYSTLTPNPRVFFYEFAHRWKNNNPLGEWIGVTHGDDYSYIFGLPLRYYPTRYSKEDVEVSEFMVKAWTTFARKGVPPQRNHHSNWPFFSAGNYLRITANNPSNPVIHKDLSKDTCEKFEKMYDQL